MHKLILPIIACTLVLSGSGALGQFGMVPCDAPYVSQPMLSDLDRVQSYEGNWTWQRDELQERRRAIRLYNSLCVRCHGVSGRGAWDIPDVPDFTDSRWQGSRSDQDIVRLTLNGRGACMPAFRGTITLEETWAITRYVREFAQAVEERPQRKRKQASETEKAQDQPVIPSPQDGSFMPWPAPVQSAAVISRYEPFPAHRQPQLDAAPTQNPWRNFGRSDSLRVARRPKPHNSANPYGMPSTGPNRGQYLFTPAIGSVD